MFGTVTLDNLGPLSLTVAQKTAFEWQNTLIIMTILLRYNPANQEMYSPFKKSQFILDILH